MIGGMAGGIALFIVSMIAFLISNFFIGTIATFKISIGIYAIMTFATVVALIDGDTATFGSWLSFTICLACLFIHAYKTRDDID